LLRDYEILFIVRPDLDEEQLGAAVKSVETLIGNLGGEHQKTDVWGRRRLAYEVSHLREGQYVLTDFRLDPERVPEMEATLRISETVFRHLVVRKPEKSSAKANGSAAGGSRPAAAASPPAAAASPEATVPEAAEAEPAAPAAVSGDQPAAQAAGTGEEEDEA
jgi:small subunit ribosomal protein S6